MTATKVISDRFKVSSLLAAAARANTKCQCPPCCSRAGLPAGFFQQEKIYATTAEPIFVATS